MTPEELLFEIDQIRLKYKNQQPSHDNLTSGKNYIDEAIELICQVKSEWCKFPSEKEIEIERQLQKEKYTTGSLSQNAYSGGFMDAINWIRRISNAPEPE